VVQPVTGNTSTAAGKWSLRRLQSLLGGFTKMQQPIPPLFIEEERQSATRVLSAPVTSRRR
jgi:hypothetical protein